jgi:hypothetical protein
MGDLNYLQSLLQSQNTQQLFPASSPTFVGLTLSGLTASLPIVTNASKALASVSYAAFKASLAIAQADVAGLTTASSPTFAGLTLAAFSGFVKATAGVLSAAVLADADIPNDITLTNITQITNRSHTSLSDIGTNTHAQIDTALAAALTNPMNAAGQLIYGGAAGAPTKLAAGATTDILVGGGAAAPVWTTATGTGAPMRGTSPTITTSLIMSDGATIGQAAGPLVTFDDANNCLKIAGCNVGIGGTSPNEQLHIAGEGIALGTMNDYHWCVKHFSGQAYLGLGYWYYGGGVWYPSGSATSAALNILYTGQVGIGILPTAQSPLRVAGLPTALAGLTTGAFYTLLASGIPPTTKVLCVA